MTDWQTVPRGLIYPEPFQEADVVLIIGGWDGTHYAASWSRLANKPIVPVATFGLAAAEIFKDELNSFDRRYSSKITLDEYQCLDRLLPDWNEKTITAFANEVIYLAERLPNALAKDVILTAKEGTNLPFDVFDIPVLYWDCQDTLEQKLSDQLTRMDISLSPSAQQDRR